MPIPRRKSCGQCRTAKARCSLSLPCERCAEKQLTCEYGSVAGHRLEPYPIQPAPASVARQSSSSSSMQAANRRPAADQAPAFGGGADGGTPSFAAPRLETSLGLCEPLLDITDPELDFFSVLNDQHGSPCIFGSHARQQQLDPHGRSGSPEGPGRAMTNNNTLFLPTRFEGVDVHSRVLCQRQAATPETSLTAKVLLGQIRQYPKMMIQGKRLPPFIHPRCASSSSSSSSGTWSSSSAAAYDACASEDRHVCLPSILAVCANLVHMFYARTAASTRFAWETIYRHQKTLHREHLRYGSDELLEALQATVVYLLLQAEEEDRDAVEVADTLALCETIHAVARRYRLLTNCPQASLESSGGPWPHSAAALVDRRAWVEVESARRTVCLLWVVELVLNVMIGPPREYERSCGGYDTIPLPCGDRLLWDAALPDAEWARRYHRWRGERKATAVGPTIGNLRFGRHEVSAGPGTGERRDGLQEWSECQLDDFCTLLWMAGMLERSKRAR